MPAANQLLQHERAFSKGQEAAEPKVTVFTSSSAVFLPDFDNGTKNIILHLHKVSVCSAGEEGNSMSSEIKEMPQALSKHITVYFYFFHSAYLKKNNFDFSTLLTADGIIET